MAWKSFCTSLQVHAILYVKSRVSLYFHLKTEVVTVLCIRPPLLPHICWSVNGIILSIGLPNLMLLAELQTTQLQTSGSRAESLRDLYQPLIVLHDYCDTHTHTHTYIYIYIIIIIIITLPRSQLTV